MAINRFARALELQQRSHFVSPGADLLDSVAGLAATLDRPSLAAVLFGAGDSWRDAFGCPRSLAARTRYPDDLRSARRQLSLEDFDAGQATGRRLTSAKAEGAITEVLAELTGSIAARPAVLTARELDVLRLVADGLGNVEIAERLTLSPRTVHAHLRSIFTKLGVGTRTAAAHEALRLGIG